MILPGNFLIGIGQILDMALTFYLWILVASVVLSWVNADPWNPIVRFLRGATDPILYRLRRAFPFLAAGGIDFTPMAVIALIYFARALVVHSLFDYGVRLKGM